MVDPHDGNGNLPALAAAGATLAPAHHARVRHSISLRNTLVVLFSRGRLISIVAATVVLITMLVVYFVPSRYHSEAKLMVRLGRESVVIDPTARIGQAAVPMEGRDKEINSEIELLKSRKLTEAIVKQIGPNRILERKSDTATSAKDVADAIAKIEEKVAVEAIPDSNILSIGYDSTDPELARDVVARLIDAYLDERSRVYRDQGDLKFFQGQLDSAKRQQVLVQRKLRELHDSSGVSNPEQQRTLLLARADTIQHDIDVAIADLASIDSSPGVAKFHREREMADQAALQARIDSLQEAKLKAQTGLSWIDEVGVKIQTLDQEQTLAAANVAKYAEAYEQARIDEQMGQDRIGNISVAEPPVLPLRPKGASRSLLLIAGLFLALSMGLGSAFVADALDHTIHHVEHLHSLGLPQVVSIPYVDDYREPYYHALSRARRVSAKGVVAPASDQAEHLEPMRPLRATIRSSAVPAVTGARDSTERDIAKTDLGSGQTFVITDDEGQEVISVQSAGNWSRPIGPLAVSPVILVAIRGLADRLIPLGDKAAARVIGVIGARNDEGASTIALHLAIALAHRVDTEPYRASVSDRVLLLDSDIETPTSSLLAGSGSARGLGDWVAMRTIDTEHLIEQIMPTRQRSLDVLPTGDARERSPLGSRMAQVLQALSPRYRHVVVDLPAVMENDASAQMAALCDSVVFVCQANELRVESAQQTLKQLHDAGAKVSVAVLNKRRYPVPEWAYKMT